jgi:hypothetical protein
MLYMINAPGAVAAPADGTNAKATLRGGTYAGKANCSRNAGAVVNGGWFPVGTSLISGHTNADTIFGSAEYNVFGRIIIPPGGMLTTTLLMLSSQTTGTFFCITWHEMQLTVAP